MKKGEQEHRKQRMSAYRGEFRIGWVTLLAATAGMSSGLALNAYINNIFGRQIKKTAN